MVPIKRDVVLFLISVHLLAGLFGATVSAATLNSSATNGAITIDIDLSESETGIINVLYNTGVEKKIKLLVQQGETKYYYNLDSNEEYVSFPLQLGDGEYTFKIYENTTGFSYKRVYYKKIEIDIEDEVAVYLANIQQITWSEEDDAIILANELVEAAFIEKNRNRYSDQDPLDLTEEEIIELLYTYVIENITYDYDKIETLEYDYIPDIDVVLEDGTGICYDYSVLFASMLRSQNIPAKLVKGYTVNTNVYHAWNEVYLSSEEEWVVVDTTFDAYYLKNDRAFEMHKTVEDYSASKVF
jgi:hypothetical protein